MYISIYIICIYIYIHRQWIHWCPMLKQTQREKPNCWKFWLFKPWTFGASNPLGCGLRNWYTGKTWVYHAEHSNGWWMFIPPIGKINESLSPMYLSSKGQDADAQFGAIAEPKMPRWIPWRMDSLMTRSTEFLKARQFRDKINAGSTISSFVSWNHLGCGPKSKPPRLISNHEGNHYQRFPTTILKWSITSPNRTFTTCRDSLPHFIANCAAAAATFRNSADRAVWVAENSGPMKLTGGSFCPALQLKTKLGAKKNVFIGFPTKLLKLLEDSSNKLLPSNFNFNQTIRVD